MTNLLAAGGIVATTVEGAETAAGAERHTVIVEKAIDTTHFHMDFRLIHPWFGEVFCYTGVFTTQHTTQQTPLL